MGATVSVIREELAVNQSEARAEAEAQPNDAPARVRQLLHIAFPDGRADVMDDSAGKKGGIMPTTDELRARHRKST